MEIYYILLSMIFFHVIADYFLQGILASMKQKSWWRENAPKRLYKYDYIAALIMHSFSWTFIVMLPLAIRMNFNVDVLFMLIFLVNVIVHAVTDDVKANRFKINLIEDQVIHILQIMYMWAFLV